MFVATKRTLTLLKIYRVVVKKVNRVCHVVLGPLSFLYTKPFFVRSLAANFIEHDQIAPLILEIEGRHEVRTCSQCTRILDHHSSRAQASY